MALSEKAKSILSQLSVVPPRMGDIKKIAKEVKSYHSLALELWSTKEYFFRLLSVLIMDKKDIALGERVGLYKMIRCQRGVLPAICLSLLELKF